MDSFYGLEREGVIGILLVVICGGIILKEVIIMGKMWGKCVGKSWGGFL